MIGAETDNFVRAFEAGWIGISGRSAKRCELAKEHGASAVFDVTSDRVDVPFETLKATQQRGVDVVFECVGSQVTMDTAIAAVRRGGMIMNVALWSKAPTVDMGLLLIKEAAISSA